MDKRNNKQVRPAAAPDMADTITIAQAKEKQSITSTGEPYELVAPAPVKTSSMPPVRPKSVEQRLIALETELVQLKQRLGVAKLPTVEEISSMQDIKAEEDSLAARVAAEKVLRKYIKRSNPKKPNEPGGFRKGLTPAEIAYAKSIMKALDRKEPEYDLELIP